MFHHVSVCNNKKQVYTSKPTCPIRNWLGPGKSTQGVMVLCSRVLKGKHVVAKGCDVVFKIKRANCMHNSAGDSSKASAF